MMKKCLQLLSLCLLFLWVQGSLCFAAQISGQVTNQTGAPLADVCVDVYTDRCWSPDPNPAVPGVRTDANGHYSFTALTDGAYYVFAQPGCNSNLQLLEEWWNDDDGTMACDEAVAVTVNESNPAVADFVLADGFLISGQITDDHGHLCPMSASVLFSEIALTILEIPRVLPMAAIACSCRQVITF